MYISLADRSRLQPLPIDDYGQLKQVSHFHLPMCADVLILNKHLDELLSHYTGLLQSKKTLLPIYKAPSHYISYFPIECIHF